MHGGAYYNDSAENVVVFQYRYITNEPVKRKFVRISFRQFRFALNRFRHVCAYWLWLFLYCFLANHKIRHKICYYIRYSLRLLNYYIIIIRHPYVTQRFIFIFYYYLCLFCMWHECHTMPNKQINIVVYDISWLLYKHNNCVMSSIVTCCAMAIAGTDVTRDSIDACMYPLRFIMLC